MDFERQLNLILRETVERSRKKQKEKYSRLSLSRSRRDPLQHFEHIELFYGLSGLPVRLSSLAYRHHGRLPEYRC